MAFAVETLGPDRTRGLQLEEIEPANDTEWRITLSMISADPLSAVLSAVTHARRDYKAFTVAKQTGEVTSMKIRELSNA